MLAVQTRFGGVEYRSRTEAQWSTILMEHGVRYEYEPIKFLFDLVAPDDWIFSRTYIPDFWLPDLKLWLEVKPHAPNLIEYRKAALLAECTGTGVLVTTGGPVESDAMVFVKNLNDIEIVSTVANGSHAQGPLKLDLDILSSTQFYKLNWHSHIEGLINVIDAANDAYQTGWDEENDRPRGRATRPKRKRVLFLPPGADHRAQCFCAAMPAGYCSRCSGPMRAFVTDECDGKLRAA
jgi:hypothetical protein